MTNVTVGRILMRQLAVFYYDPKAFTADELSTMETVFAVTRGLTTEQIVDKSHNEPAWANHKSQNGFIPYSEAFSLILL